MTRGREASQLITRPREKKDLAGASLEFDVRQKGINDAT
jgi:hypothetical protein